MKVYVWGHGEPAEVLIGKISGVLDELGLTDFVKVESTQDEAMQSELSISESYALVIEEESINFKDMIFEGIVPEDEELKSMFISIIGGSSGGGCAPEGCGSGCSC